MLLIICVLECVPSCDVSTAVSGLNVCNRQGRVHILWPPE